MPLDAAITPKSAKPGSAKADQFIINISFSKDGEPRDVFVGGCEEGDFLITRGKDVKVPKSVLERLDCAVIGVAEVDPEDSLRTVVSERRRFPYTIVASVPA